MITSFVTSLVTSLVNDIDSLLNGNDSQTFDELERKFQTINKFPVQYYRDEARKSLTLFISKCQDIDEMIDPTSPISPTNQLSNFNSSSFCKLFEKIEEEDDSVAVDVSDVKVHNGKAMKSTVEAYTEEIDSSAVRIRENKALSVHLSKITEEIDEDFNQNHIQVNRKYSKTQSRYSSKGNSSTSSISFGSAGSSALNLYTNKTHTNKSSSSSGYTSDHYSSPSFQTMGYISDVGSNYGSKGSHQTNTCGSSSGVRTYSSYPYTSATMSRNLSTNTSRVPAITYSSYNSGYTQSMSPNPPKYVSYTRPNSQNNFSNNTFDGNNNNTNNNTKTLKNKEESIFNNKTNNKAVNKLPNKAPADFTSDSEDDTNDIEMRCHTNIIFTSRSTSPNRESSHLRGDSISTTQQIIRPKK